MASKRKKSNRSTPVIDISQARSNLEAIRQSVKELGWKEKISYQSQRTDICWLAGGFIEDNADIVKHRILVNKFPGMSDILSKSNLTRLLNAMQSLFPDQYNFYPRTWFLPEQVDKFQEDVKLIHEKDKQQHRSATVFIVKPSDGAEGAGIYLIQEPTRCPSMNRPHVVQEYIKKPLLLDGLKFDMRIYVLLLNLDPLEIFLYEDGLARFATVQYKKPTKLNMHESFMHLTNYSLNKRSDKYKHAVDENQEDASKRKLSVVWSQLVNTFGQAAVDECQEEIKNMIIKTILAILPDLRIQYSLQFPASELHDRCFQIVGFDVLLNSQLKPILLEVNANPSMRIDFDHVNDEGKYLHDASPIDEEIKKSLIMLTLKVVINDHQRRKKSAMQDVDVHQQQHDNDETLDVNCKTELSNDTDDEGETAEERQNMNDPLISISNKAKKPQLTRIYSSTADHDYKEMFILERIALIYITLVIKRGYKAMTNRPFRTLAKICGLLEDSTAMASVDLLYSQIFYKCKQYASQSPATGLEFSGFLDAFFLLTQKKYSTTSHVLDNVKEVVDSCCDQLDIKRHP